MEATPMSETVHIGANRWHIDRGGLPGCPQVQFQTETTVTTRAEAEQKGYDRCKRCATEAGQ